MASRQFRFSRVTSAGLEIAGNVIFAGKFRSRAKKSLLCHLYFIKSCYPIMFHENGNNLLPYPSLQFFVLFSLKSSFVTEILNIKSETIKAFFAEFPKQSIKL